MLLFIYGYFSSNLLDFINALILGTIWYSTFVYMFQNSSLILLLCEGTDN
jgi:hypothetical protein